MAENVFDSVDVGTDLGGVPRGFRVFPEGKYLAEIIDMTMFINDSDPSKKSINVTLQIVDCEVTDPNERSLIVNGTWKEMLSLQPTALWKVAQFGDAALGHAISGAKIRKSDFVGKRLVVQLGVREYEDKKGEKRTANQSNRFDSAGTWQSATKLADDVKIDGTAGL